MHMVLGDNSRRGSYDEERRVEIWKLLDKGSKRIHQGSVTYPAHWSQQHAQANDCEKKRSVSGLGRA